jgi:hypothetical protein
MNSATSNDDDGGSCVRVQSPMSAKAAVDQAEQAAAHHLDQQARARKFRHRGLDVEHGQHHRASRGPPGLRGRARAFRKERECGGTSCEKPSRRRSARSYARRPTQASRSSTLGTESRHLPTSSWTKSSPTSASPDSAFYECYVSSVRRAQRRDLTGLKLNPCFARVDAAMKCLADLPRVVHAPTMNARTIEPSLIPSAPLDDLDLDNPTDEAEWERRVMALAAARIVAERARLEQLGIIDKNGDLVSHELPPDMNAESDTTVETG